MAMPKKSATKPNKTNKSSLNRPYNLSKRSIQLKELQELSGINSRTLSDYLKNGCNVFDHDELRTYLDTLDKRPSTIKRSFYTPPGSVDSLNISSEEEADLELLKKELMLSKDKNEVNRIKAQIEALKTAQQLEILNKSSISIIVAEEAFIKIGAVLKSQLLKLQADLPPQLYGMSQANIQIRIREYVTKILDEFSSNDRVWDMEHDKE